MLTVEYLRRVSDVRRACAIHPTNVPSVAAYCQQESSHATMLSFTEMDFRSPAFADLLGNHDGFDVVFIDGDHSYPGVAADFASCKGHGNVFVFHNIANKACPGVVQFWKDLKTGPLAENFDFHEFTEQYDEVVESTGNTYLGIGVAVCRPEHRRTMPVPPAPQVAFITAIVGGYEKTCKPHAAQSVPADFFCFAPGPGPLPDGGGDGSKWIIDTVPYHVLCPSPQDDGLQYNSNNRHTFFLAKYYKTSFHLIPVLRRYRYVVWLDGTIEITSGMVAEAVPSLTTGRDTPVCSWKHEHRNRKGFAEEVAASHFVRYTSTHWFGQDQPYQDVDRQYESYLAKGFDETFFHKCGVWVTCFVAFDLAHPLCVPLLETWYRQVLEHTTQDQLGFPFAAWVHKVQPYTLPDAVFSGDRPHTETCFYRKLAHFK